MASKTERTVIDAAGLVRDIVLVTFPAARSRWPWPVSKTWPIEIRAEAIADFLLCYRLDRRRPRPGLPRRADRQRQQQGPQSPQPAVAGFHIQSADRQRDIHPFGMKSAQLLAGDGGVAWLGKANDLRCRQR